MIFNNIKFGQYDNDKNYNWLTTKSYLVYIQSFINYLEIEKALLSKQQCQ